jgi:hypothetical protein
VGRESQGTQATLGSRLLGKSRLPQLSYEENQSELWEEVKILDTGKNPVYTKYKEA